MSLGYAEKLSYREDLGGQIGTSEIYDSGEVFSSKVEEFIVLVRDSKRIVVFTGAGISTSCGIPDFRGPRGVWTLQRAGQPVPIPKVSFAAAKPSLTHQALVALLRTGKVSYIVSQNVDGLHLRSGIPRDQLAELHGNCFAERCSKCRLEYIRDFEIETVGFKATGRRCGKRSCRGVLKDHILDWEDALPEDELKESERQATQADLAICLGTSLQVTPACNLPLRTVKAGGKLVIVNLQATPKDKKADLLIHARCDDVIRQLMNSLAIPMPVYRREDTVTLTCNYTMVKQRGKGKWGMEVVLSYGSCESDGKTPIAIVDSIRIEFLEPSGVAAAVLSVQPFRYTTLLPSEGREAAEQSSKLVIRTELHLSGAADPNKRLRAFTTTFEISLSRSRHLEGLQGPSQAFSHTFLSQEVDYNAPAEPAENLGRQAKRRRTDISAAAESLDMDLSCCNELSGAAEEAQAPLIRAIEP